MGISMAHRELSPIEIRLINWGRWNQLRGIPNLNPPSFTQLMSEYIKQGNVFIRPDEKDAMELEAIISTLDLAGRGIFSDGDASMKTYILRLEFIERDKSARQANKERYERRYKKSICDRTYRRHYDRAVKMVERWCNPLNSAMNVQRNTL